MDWATIERARQNLSKKVGREVSPDEFIDFVAKSSGYTKDHVLKQLGFDKSDSFVGDLGDAIQSGVAKIPGGVAAIADFIAAANTPDVIHARAKELENVPEEQKTWADKVAEVWSFTGSGRTFQDVEQLIGKEVFGMTADDYAKWNQLETTDETQQALKEVDSAEGIGILGAYIANPRAAFYRAAESLSETAPFMGVGGKLAVGAARALGAGRLASTIAGVWGAGTAATLPGQMQAATEYNQQHEVDRVSDGQLAAAFGTSAITGAIDVAAFRIARVLGGTTAEGLLAKALAGTKDTTPSVSGTLNKIGAAAKGFGASTISEGGAEAIQSFQETAGINYANTGDPNFNEAFNAAMHGAAVGAATGMGAHVIEKATNPLRKDEVEIADDIVAQDSVEDAVAVANSAVSQPAQSTKTAQAAQTAQPAQAAQPTQPTQDDSEEELDPALFKPKSVVLREIAEQKLSNPTIKELYETGSPQDKMRILASTHAEARSRGLLFTTGEIDAAFKSYLNENKAESNQTFDDDELSGGGSGVVIVDDPVVDQLLTELGYTDTDKTDEVAPAATTQPPTQTQPTQTQPTQTQAPAATTQPQPVQNTSPQIAPPAKKINDTLLTLVGQRYDDYLHAGSEGDRATQLKIIKNVALKAKANGVPVSARDVEGAFVDYEKTINRMAGFDPSFGNTIVSDPKGVEEILGVVDEKPTQPEVQPEVQAQTQTQGAAQPEESIQPEEFAQPEAQTQEPIQPEEPAQPEEQAQQKESDQQEDRLEIRVDANRKIIFDSGNRVVYPATASKKGNVANFSIPALVDVVTLARLNKPGVSKYNTIKFKKSDGKEVSVSSIDDFKKVAREDAGNEKLDFAELAGQKEPISLKSVPKKIKYAIALGRANAHAAKIGTDLNKNGVGKRSIDEQASYITHYIKAYKDLFGDLSKVDEASLRSYLLKVHRKMSKGGGNREASPNQLRDLFERPESSRKVETKKENLGRPSDQKSVYEFSGKPDDTNEIDGGSASIVDENQADASQSALLDELYEEAVVIRNTKNANELSKTLKNFADRLSGEMQSEGPIKNHLITLAKVLVADEAAAENALKVVTKKGQSSDTVNNYAAELVSPIEKAVKDVELDKGLLEEIGELAKQASEKARLKKIEERQEAVDEQAVAEAADNVLSLTEELRKIVEAGDYKKANKYFHNDIGLRLIDLLESLGYGNTGEVVNGVFERFNETIKGDLLSSDQRTFDTGYWNLIDLVTDLINYKFESDPQANTPFKRGIKLVSMYNQALERAKRNDDDILPEIALPPALKRVLTKTETTQEEEALAREALGETWRDVVKSIPEFTISKKVVETPTDPVRMRDAIKQMTGVRNLPFVNIFSSPETLSKHLGIPVPKNAAGLVYGGKVYLITKNIAKGDEASVLAHELGVHVAAERYLDAKDFASFASEILLLYKKGDKAATAAVEAAERSISAAGVQKYDLDYADRYTRELVANYVEQTYAATEKPSLLQRIIRWVVNLLNKAGLKIKPQFVAEHLKEIVDGMVGRLITEGGYGAEYDGGAHAVSARAPLYTAAPEKSDVIDVDGKQRPTRNSEGRLIHPTEEGIRNFWRWFGDSKVVDEQGRPLVVYHGTKHDFAEFQLGRADRSDGGWFGDGFYLTASQYLASSYAMRERDNSLTDRPANVMPAYVRMSNPYRINLGELSYNEASNFTKKYGGNEGFRKWLADNGYDGVIGYRDPEIAGQGAEFWEVVVFDPAQIKSAIGNRGTFDPSTSDIRYSVAPEKPDEETIIGQAMTGKASRRTVRDFIRGVVPSSLIHRLDAATNTLENLVDEATRKTTYAVRTGQAKLIEDTQLLPSIKPFYEAITRRSEEAKSIMFTDDAIQHMLSSLDDKYREEVTKIATWMRRYELWAFDPSDWHPAIWSEDRIKAYIEDKKRDNKNYNPKKDAFLVKKVLLLKEIRESIDKQIAHGNMLHKNGKPVSSMLVAWRFNNLKNGLSADGKKLPESEANQARRAAAAIEMIFRELHEVDKRAQEAIKDRLKPIQTALYHAEKALKQIEALLASGVLKNDSDASAIPESVWQITRRIPGGLKFGKDADVKDVVKALNTIIDTHKQTIQEFNKMIATYQNRTVPYVPHVRVGDHFLIAKSQLYRFFEYMMMARAEYVDALREGGLDKANSPATEERIRAHAERAFQELQSLTDEAAGKYADIVDNIRTNLGTDVDSLVLLARDKEAWDDFKLSETISLLKRDADHYAVFSFLTRAERTSIQERLQNALSEPGGNPTNITLEALDQTEALERSRITSESLASILALIRSTKTDDQNAKAAMENIVHRMYLSMYSDMITVQNKKHAKNVFGYIHSYLPHSVSRYIRETANYVAAMKYNATIEELVARLQEEAKRPFPILDDKDRELAAAYVNTIVKRWNQLRSREEVLPVVEGILTVSSVWTLTTNPSYYFGNALQNHIVAAPLIGGLGWKVGKEFKFVGEARALSKLHEALKITAPAVAKTSKEFEKLIIEKMKRGDKITIDDYKLLLSQEHVKKAIETQFKAKYGADYAAFLTDVIDTLNRRGLLDMGLNVDMGDIDAAIGVLGYRTTTRRVLTAFSKLPAAGRNLSQAIEVANRSAAALATIESLIEVGNLDRKALTEAQKSELLEKALMIIQDAHGNYSATSRPTWFASRNVLLKLSMQFRYYSHILLRTLIKLAKYSLSKELTTEEERQMYRRMFTRLMLHTMVLFGVRGLPLIGPMMALLWAVGLACGDEAECEKMKAMSTSAGMDYRIRKALGDNAFADFISGGLATMLLRLDVSARFGLANIGGIMPFEDSYVTDLFKSYNDYLESTVKLAFGAFGNTLGSIVRGIDLISQYPDGSYNTWKGLAYMAPIGFRNMMYALMWSMYGIRTRSGNPILDKENINAYEAIMKAIGFQPKVAADAYTKYGSMTELKKRLYAYGGSLKQRYHEAVMNGDRERADEIREEIREFRQLLRKLGLPYKSYTNKGLRQYSRSKLKRQEKDEELADEWFGTED